MTEANLGELFASAARDVYRLETLQAYNVPGEEARLAAWRAGVPWPEGETPWQQRIRTLTGRGVRMRRVHLVELPVSEYLRWEITGYQRNAKLGEEIAILQAGQLPVDGPAATDYWLIDDRTVVLMHYDSEGRLTGRELYDGDPTPYATARDEAWSRAQPLDSWCKYWGRG